MEALWDWFRWLYEAHGINFSVFYDSWNRGRFFEGLRMTLYLSVTCLVLSVVIGIIGAFMQRTRIPLVRPLIQGYVQFFRNTPPLVQLYFFYFALGNVLPAMAEGGQLFALTNVGWAIVSLSLFAGAFNVEIFRAGIEAVPRTTVEAAESLGYTRAQAFFYVILPLAFRISLPALNNNLVNLVKTTTLAYAIGVPELLYISAQIWSEELNVLEMMNLLLVIYFGLVAILVLAMNRWERAIRVPGYGA